MSLAAEAESDKDLAIARILVIDDDHEFSEGLELVLSIEGYEVMQVYSASAARNALESFDADIALIDIRLAGSSGINLLSSLKQKRPNLLCVMMTAYASTDTVIEALQEGAYDYLRKPFDTNDLLATLGRCVERESLEKAKVAADSALRERNLELEHINKRLQLVVHSMRTLTGCDRLRELYPKVLEEVARNMAADGGSVYLNEEDALTLKHALDPGHAPSRIPLPAPESSVFGQVLATAQPVLVEDVGTSQGILPSGWAGYNDKSLLAFPLVGDAGDKIGVLSLHTKADPPFTQQDRDIGQILISFVGETIRTVQVLEKLAKSEERYRSLVETCPVCIQELDLEGHFISMNPAGLELMGFEGEAEAQQHDYFEAVRQDDLGKVREMFDLACAGQTCNFESVADLNNGARTLATCFAPLLNSDGTVHRIMVIVQDFTERVQAEEQLRQTQKMEAIGHLTGGVAHDFNNLLAIILGNADLMSGRLGQHSDLSRYTNTIIRASTRGAELTQRLLAFSRRQPLQPQTINLADLVQEMEGMLVRTLGEIVNVESRAAPDLWHVMADASQLENAVLNLAINARDAMRDGGELVFEMSNISVSGEGAASDQAKIEPGGYVILEVRDTGTGMSPEVLEHAVEPFFTTKKVGEGSGLGLSMVYGFANQSNGHLSIESEVGRGTSIKLYLPWGEAEAKQHVALQHTEPRAQGETILVVEDDAEVLILVISLLESLDYTVLTAGNGQSALALLEEGQAIDLMLSDVILPGGMSAPDLAEVVLQRDPDQKILFMSGYMDGAASFSGLLDNGFDLLKKPFRKIDLARKVRSLLD